MMSMEEALAGKSTSPLRSAILLAMTEDMEAEKLVKDYWQKKGQSCAVTMLGGNSRALKEKLPGAVIGACLNNNLIEKNQESIHPVLHAVMEAAKGAKVNAVLEQNYQLKIAIVREGHWIAVAMYGKMGFHELSDHHTIGCGRHIIP